MKQRARLVLLWMVFGFGPGLLAQDAEELLNAGKKKIQSGDLGGAIVDLDRALELSPKNVAAYNSRGQAKRRQGDLTGAIADFTSALEIDPKSVLALSDRGFTRMNLGDLDGALADHTRALALNPQGADRFNALGIVKHMRGDFPAALADYDRAIELAPAVTGYARIYRELLARRAELAPAGFAQAVESWRDGWPKTAGKHVAGTLDEATFLAAAAKGDAKTVREQECRAFYFAGMVHLLADDRVGARTLFEKCLSTDVKIFNEYGLARAELERLAK